MNIYKTKKGESLDLIAWRHYGHLNGTFEHLLYHNPDLCQQSIILEPGIEIQLPPLQESKKKVVEMVELWD